MKKMRVKGTKFEVRFAMILFMFVNLEMVKGATDQDQIQQESSGVVVLELNKPPKKLDDIEKLKAKYPDIFKKIESDNRFDRITGISQMVKYFKMSKEEKESVLIWAVKSSADDASIAAALQGLLYIKASNNELRGIVKNLLSSKDGKVLYYAIRAIDEFGLTDLKDDLIDFWKRSFKDKQWNQKVPMQHVLESLWKLDLSKSDFEAIIEHTKYYYWGISEIDTKNIHLKRFFGELLSNSDASLVGIGIAGVIRFKAVEFKEKLIDIVKSKTTVKFAYVSTLGRYAMDALVEIGSKEDAKELLLLLEHKDDGVKEKAIHTIASLGGIEYKKEIGEMLKDKSASVCLMAISALTKLKAKEYVEDILEQISRREFPYAVRSIAHDSVTAESLIASAIRELFDASKYDALITFYKKLGIPKWNSVNWGIKQSILSFLVESKVQEILPIVVKELKSLEEPGHSSISLDYPQLRIFTHAIIKLGNLKENGEEIAKILKHGCVPIQSYCIDILKAWKAKEYGENVASLLQSDDLKLVYKSMEFLIEMDCVSKDLEVYIRKFFKRWIGDPGCHFSLDTLAKKNSTVYSLYVEILIEELRSDFVKISFPCSSETEFLLSKLTESQKKKLEEIALEKVKDGQLGFIPVLDYKTYKKEILQALIKFGVSEAMGEKLGAPAYSVGLLSWANPETRSLLSEKMTVITMEHMDKISKQNIKGNQKVVGADILDALSNSGYKVEVKGSKLSVKTAMYQGGYVIEFEPTVSSIIRTFESYGVYLVLEPGKKILVFDDASGLKEYLETKVSE